MATEAAHIALANKNHDVLIHLIKDVDRFPEWVTVVAFYKAVQIIDAAFEHTHGQCCHGHPRRLEMLKSRGYRELHKHYRALWSASSVARYLYDNAEHSTYSCFTDYLSADAVREKIVKKRLSNVEGHALKLLGDDLANALKRVPVD